MNQPLAINHMLANVNSVVGALFLLSAVVLMTQRQAQAVLRWYIRQSILLALSAFILGWLHHSAELMIVGLITIVAKAVVIPQLLTSTLGPEIRSRRELDFIVNTPVSLLIAIALTVLSYFFVAPLLHGANETVLVNLPVGLDVLLIGVYTLTVRGEAVPQMLAMMAIDNGAFYAGIAITTSSAIVELAAGLEGVMVVLVAAILARTLAQRVGSTEVSEMTDLKEGEKEGESQ
jgi:hydrogenase-4 component E